jgi:nicotinate-nucleotide adenylyltransferase
MGRIGIFGGTFDPPHIGHLILAAEAYQQLALERLLWVLTPDPPHKQNMEITPLAHRLDMIQAAISGDPNFELSTVDIDRPGPHYAVDTLKILNDKKPGMDWIYIMGGDSLRDLPLWRAPVELVNMVTALGVMIRPGVKIDLARIELYIPGVSAKVKYINSPLLDISASDIRQRVEDGQAFRYLVPPGVYQIILDRGLYRSN